MPHVGFLGASFFLISDLYDAIGRADLAASFRNRPVLREPGPILVISRGWLIG